jgi:hypothetical protein
MGKPTNRPCRTWERCFSKRYLVIPAVAALLAASGGGLAQAAGGSPVVPPGGTVAGHGYGYWLAAADRVFFAYGGSPPPCQTLHADGQAVEFLDGVDTDQQINYSVPTGEPIYVHGISNECSTIKGDHNGFGTSPAQLERCARKGFKGDGGTAWLDGVKVANYRRLIAATNAVEIHVPKHNSFYIPGQSATSAGYGEGTAATGSGRRQAHDPREIGYRRWESDKDLRGARQLRQD